MSQTMKVPPIKSSKQYRAATIFTIPESFFKKDIEFYVIGRFHGGEYGSGPAKKQMKFRVCGSTDPVQKDLVLFLVEKVKKQLFVSVRANS